MPERVTFRIRPVRRSRGTARARFSRVREHSGGSRREGTPGARATDSRADRRCKWMVRAHGDGASATAAAIDCLAACRSQGEGDRKTNSSSQQVSPVCHREDVGMLHKTHDSDRRILPRQPAAGRVTWRLGAAPRSYVGYLSDRSRLGLSFVSGSAVAPAVGELLELRDANGLQRCLRVVRVAPYDDVTHLIACRAVRAERTPTPST